MNKRLLLTAIFVAVSAAAASKAFAAGDAEKGAQAFRACAACHSLNAGDHRTGPSLAGISGRTAGTVAGFNRYSKALKDSGIVWNDDVLDRWIRDPKALVPGNRMVYRGIADKKVRDDLIAFLKSASADKPKAAAGGMGGMGHHGGEVPNLKDVGANNRVTAMTHCKDTFTVTTAAGEMHPFWSLNLRIKVDASDTGPPPGNPVLIPAGMMGDRASVVFAAPGEISAFIKNGC